MSGVSSMLGSCMSRVLSSAESGVSSSQVAPSSVIRSSKGLAGIGRERTEVCRALLFPAAQTPCNKQHHSISKRPFCAPHRMSLLATSCQACASSTWLCHSAVLLVRKGMLQEPGCRSSSPWASPRGGLRGPAQTPHGGREALARAALTARSSARQSAATTGRAQRARHGRARKPLRRPRPHGERSPH